MEGTLSDIVIFQHSDLLTIKKIKNNLYVQYEISFIFIDFYLSDNYNRYQQQEEIMEHNKDNESQVSVEISIGQSKHSGFEMGFDELIQLHQKQVQYLTEIKKLIENKEVDYNYYRSILNLQNFIVKVGTMLTFALLQSMSPELENQLSRVKDIISSANLLYEFKNIILGSRYTHLKKYSTGDNKHPISSRYQLDKN